LATLGIILLWYRKSIHEMTVVMHEHRQTHHGLGPLIRIPYRRGLFVLIATVCIIAFHHQIENILGLTGMENKNAFLIITPLIIAGLLMISKPNRARHYIEHDVEWWTLLFFMLLFAIAGGLEEQGITRNLADKLTSTVKGGPTAMVPFVLAISAAGSAFVDNIVFVAAFTPVIQTLVESSSDYTILWWALLFGACFGGNITVIGSTANIVALGLLEKRGHVHIAFFEWLKIGLLVGVVTCLIAWAMLTVMPMPRPKNHHPAPAEQHEAVSPPSTPSPSPTMP
jgi:Na+/H+ antiporter NhaD/arsenite permease-like protein